ncbi:hypothetical protein O3P69_007723 [Scylla paramamosain]|uniref:Uncharacterized protein n=1 Tax=Scylla paramamosain TaxID=85552 RepID=A0AAW0UX09_SCYPA
MEVRTHILADEVPSTRTAVGVKEDSDQQWREELKNMFAVIARSVNPQERKLDTVQEGLQDVMQQARRFTTEQCERLRGDLAQELAAVKVESEERAEAGEARLEELREEVTGLQSSLEKQSGPQPVPAQFPDMWGRPECPGYAVQGHYYAWSTPRDTGLCADDRGQPGERPSLALPWPHPAATAVPDARKCSHRRHERRGSPALVSLVCLSQGAQVYSIAPDDASTYAIHNGRTQVNGLTKQ